MKTNTVRLNGPWLILRAEAGAELAAALALFHFAGGSWAALAALFLAPDLSMLGYLAGPRAGAALYNLAHSYGLPAALLGLAWALDGWGRPSPLWLAWFAHIAFDRLMGYGLKFSDRFGHTHLGMIGKAGN